MADHKYTELANKLRDDILSGAYTEGSRLPSENELAEQTGYSRQTVRQALGVLEREGIARRVQGSGTFVQRPPLRSTRTGNIAVVTTYISEYIFPSILDSMEAVLEKNSYTPMLFATRNRVDNERRILQLLQHKPIDGLIVEGTKTALPNPNIDLYQEIAELGIPIVLLSGFYPELKNSVYVVTDDRAGGRMACERLLRAGHKRIAGIFKSDDIQGHRRYAGYMEALQHAGLSVEDNHVLWYTTENRDSMLAAFVAQAVHGCTAAVCYNDETTLELISVMQKQGIRIPQQLELVSFDNSAFAQLSQVPFVSLTSPKEDLGRLAAEKMIDLLAGNEQTSIVLPWGLNETE